MLTYIARKIIPPTLNTSEMIPVDIWTMAMVLQPSQMDTLGYKMTYELIDFWKVSKDWLGLAVQSKRLHS